MKENIKMNSAVRFALLFLTLMLVTAEIVHAQTECEEIDISARMSSAEDRISRLEDRLYAVLVQSPDGVGSNDTLILADLVERFADIAKSLEDMKSSSQEDDTPVVCERGMASTVSEPFLIMDDDTIGKQIRCDTQTDGGGWIVFQRRATGDVDFYRNWAEYRDGFGSPDGDFWLGNEALHILTNAHSYELRIDVTFDGQDFFAQFSNMKLENEAQKYLLRLGTYSGTVGDAGGSGMIFSKDGPFSTYDQDNDSYSSVHCAVTYHGGWWHKQCSSVNPNGEWGTNHPRGMRWYNGQVHRYATFTEMKIRRV